MFDRVIVCEGWDWWAQLTLDKDFHTSLPGAAAVDVFPFMIILFVLHISKTASEPQGPKSHRFELRPGFNKVSN